MAEIITRIKKGKERIEEVQNYLGEIVKNKDTGKLKDYLRKSVLFPGYSLRNSVMISMQCPNATRVTGKKAWERFGMKPRNEEDCIYITAAKWKIWGNEKDKKEWLAKNPLAKIESSSIVEPRMRALKTGMASPTDEEKTILSQETGRDIFREYSEWLMQKPKSVIRQLTFVPAAVYDISQCEIYDEEKAKNLPMPEVKISTSEDDLLRMVEEIVKESGIKIDDSLPQGMGRFADRVIYVSNNAETGERLFHLLQGLAQAKTKTLPRETIAVSTCAAAMVLFATGAIEDIKDEIIEPALLQIKTPIQMNTVLSKSNEAFKSIMEDLEKERKREITRQKQEITENIDWAELENM